MTRHYHFDNLAARNRAIREYSGAINEWQAHAAELEHRLAETEKQLRHQQICREAEAAAAAAKHALLCEALRGGVDERELVMAGRRAIAEVIKKHEGYTYDVETAELKWT